jgi:peptidoglycan-N-acetylmuramic acid deacetylase
MKRDEVTNTTNVIKFGLRPAERHHMTPIRNGKGMFKHLPRNKKEKKERIAKGGVMLFTLVFCTALTLGGCGRIRESGLFNQTTVTETQQETSEMVTTTEPTIAETTRATLETNVPLDDITDARYEDISNELTKWWYRRPEQLGEGLPVTIDEPVQDILSSYQALWQAPAGKKTVYITSDEGYEIPGNTPKILDAAKEKDFVINFFITGQYVESNPDLVLRMLDEGHVVANHSQLHKNGPKTIAELGVRGLVDDLDVANNKMIEVSGQSFAPFFRPPEGVFSERSLAVIRDMGYHAVFWSFAYVDWIADDQPDPEAAKEKILEELHDGSILLLHANSVTNANILGDLVDEIRARGYEIGDLNDVLGELGYLEEAATKNESDLDLTVDTLPGDDLTSSATTTLGTESVDQVATAVRTTQAQTGTKDQQEQGVKQEQGVTLRPDASPVPSTMAAGQPVIPETAKTTATPR